MPRSLIRIHIVVGPGGSGKSTLARQLARRSAAAYVDKDALAAGLVDLALGLKGVPPSGRDSDTFYRQQVMPREYDAVWRVVRDNVMVGRPVTIDAPFIYYFSDPNYLAGALQAHGLTDVEPIVVQIEVDEATLRQRIEQRNLRRDDWKLANWPEFWSRSTSQPCQWQGVKIVRVQNGRDAKVDDLCTQILSA